MHKSINAASPLRTQALALVDKERDRQEAKWGEQNHAPQYWVGILGEEYGEYCQAVNETVFDNGSAEREKGGTANMITELSHVAAVAVGAIECLLRDEWAQAPNATCGDCGFKDHSKAMTKLHNCNDCGRQKDCAHAPKPGQWARINCFMWEMQP